MEDLKNAAEVGLEQTVLENGQLHLAQYGHLVYEAVKTQDSRDWLPGLLASSYWRIKGRPVEAIKCLRNAIKFSPEKYR